MSLKSMAKTSIANEAMLKEKGYKTPIEKTTELINSHYQNTVEDIEFWESVA